MSYPGYFECSLVLFSAPGGLVLYDCGKIQNQNWWGSAIAASGLARRDDPPIEVIKLLTAP